jgi:hypothetical protein
VERRACGGCLGVMVRPPVSPDTRYGPAARLDEPSWRPLSTFPCPQSRSAPVARRTAPHQTDPVNERLQFDMGVQLGH